MMSTAIMQIVTNEYEVRTYSVKRVTDRDSKSDSRERERIATQNWFEIHWLSVSNSII